MAVQLLQLALWATLPLLLAAWLLLRRRKPPGNAPPIVSKGYSSVFGHAVYVATANDMTPDKVLYNIEELVSSADSPVCALYCMGPRWLASPLYFVKDPALGALVYNKGERFEAFEVAARTTIGKYCIPALQGEQLKRHRRIMAAGILVRASLARLVEITGETMQASIQALQQAHHQSQSSGSEAMEINMTEGNMIGKMLIDAFVHFSFGVDLKPSSSVPEEIRLRRRLHEKLDVIFKLFADRISHLGPLKVLSYASFGSMFRAWRTQSFLRNEVVQPAIERRLRAMRAGDDVPNDTMTMMLRGRLCDGDDRGEDGNEMFSDEEICHEAVMMIVAGYEATEASLLWCFCYLALHQEHQEKCHREIDDVMSKQVPGALPSLDDTDKFVHLQHFISEVHRVQPAAHGSSRTFYRDFPLGDYTIPAGSTVMVMGYIMSHSDSVFDRASEFLPDRWKDDPTGGIKQPGAGYVPFGQGPHRCFGMQMAACAMRSILAVWIQRVRFELVNEKIEDTYRIANVPKNLKLRMYPR